MTGGEEMARVPFVKDEEVPAEVEEVFDSARRSFGVVYNTYRVLGHRPEIVKAWHELLASIMGTGNVDPQLKGLAAAAGSEVNECHY